jgi:serine/threonine protein kinase
VFIPNVGGGGMGKIKIADFGLSKIVWNEETMTPCGTVGYTAPEIVKDERYSKSVDMWAMGCVLYTLLCGFPRKCLFRDYSPTGSRKLNFSSQHSMTSRSKC